MSDALSILALALALVALLLVALRLPPRPRSYPTLSAAVRAHKSLPSTLEITAPLPVDTPTSVPANVECIFSGAGRLVKTGAGSVTFEATNIRAGLGQIFEGFAPGEISLTRGGSFVYPEWWGARADASDPHTGTDSLEPFRCAIRACINNVPYVGYLNSTVRASLGGYRFSDELLIDTPIILEGSGPGTSFYFDTRRAGREFMKCIHVSVEGYGTTLRDFRCEAAEPEYSGTCDVEGRTVRRLTGPSFLTSFPFGGLNEIIRLGQGWAEVENVLDADTLLLAPQRPGQLCHVHENNVYLAQRVVGPLWNPAWVVPDATITISGHTYNIEQVVDTGRVLTTTPILTMGENQSWTADNNPLKGERWAPITQHVIFCEGTTYVERISMQGMWGSGVMMDSRNAVANCNNWSIRDCRIGSSHANAYFIIGTNSNGGTLSNCYSLGNWGHAFVERSLLGNTYTAPLAEAGQLAPYWEHAGGVGASHYTNPYQEGGHPLNQFDRWSTYTGGVGSFQWTGARQFLEIATSPGPVLGAVPVYTGDNPPYAPALPDGYWRVRNLEPGSPVGIFEITTPLGMMTGATFTLSVVAWDGLEAQNWTGAYRLTQVTKNVAGFPVYSALDEISAGPALCTAGTLLVAVSKFDAGLKTTVVVEAETSLTLGAGYLQASYSVASPAGQSRVIPL